MEERPRSRDLRRDAAGAIVERLAARLQVENETIPEIDLRVRRRGYAVLDYVSGRPGATGVEALGRCIYVVRPNRIARFFGLNITHTARPFLGSDDRRPAVQAVTGAEVESAFRTQHLTLVKTGSAFELQDVPSGRLTVELGERGPSGAAVGLVHFANVWVEYRLSGTLKQRTDAALATLKRDAFD